MAKRRNLKRAMTFLLTLSLVMNFFSVSVLADSVTNPDGTTTETTVSTDTQNDTPLEGYTTETVTTTAVTTGTATGTGAVVDETVTSVDTQVTDENNFVRYGESCEQGDRAESIPNAAVSGDGPNVTVTLDPDHTVTGTETAAGTPTAGTHTDVKAGANDPIYDYDQTTTTTTRTVEVTAGPLTVTTNVSVMNSNLPENNVFNLEPLQPVDYEGRTHITDNTPSTPPSYVNYLQQGKYRQYGRGLVANQATIYIGGGYNNYAPAEHYLLWSNAQENSLPIYAYCVDVYTNVDTDAGYTIQNLEDSTFFPADGAEKLRSITLNGYWGTESGLGSLAQLKQSMKDALEDNGLPESIHVRRGSGGTGLEWDFAIDEDFIDGITEGEFMAATQGAMWAVTRAGIYCEYSPVTSVYGSTVYDDGHMDRDLGEGRMIVVYNYLCGNYDCGLPAVPELETTLIGEQFFLDDDGLSITVKNKVEGSTDVYNTDLSFTPVVAPTEEDDLTVTLLDADGNVLRFARLAGEAQPGEEQLPGYCVLVQNGNTYTFEDIQLTENTDTDFVLSLDGTQNVRQGAYLFRAWDYYWSQTFVTVAKGTNLVDVDAEFSLNFSVSESASQEYEHHWRDESLILSVEKNWVNDSASDRPASVIVQLYADGDPVAGKTVTLTAADNWAPKQFTGLVKHVDDTGEEITYSVQEVADGTIADYTPSYGGSAGSGFIVTNTRTAPPPETVDVSGSKRWLDGGETDGRPASIKINLLANGTLKDSKTVTAADNWAWSWTGLDKYDADGQLIIYTITENRVPNYRTVVRGYNVTNIKRTAVSGSKTWADYGNADNTRPDSITINLLANGTLKDSKTVTAADNWAWSWTNLYKYDANNQLIVYTITEDAVAGYVSAVNGYNVTNTYTATVDVSGSKTWVDYGNADNTRPGSITINLLANGVLKESKTVTAADNWAWSWTGLDKYDASNQLITYTITEDAVAGYVSAVNGYNVTNTYTATVDVSGSKTWADYGNADNTRPGSITINLLANGVLKESKTVTAAENWAWSWTGLDKYDASNQLITYTITEDAVTGYVSAVNGYNVTNTYTATVDVTVVKEWNDSNNQDQIRPGSITVRLLANGLETGDTLTLNEGNGWSGKFDGLDKYDAGNNLIVYSVEEVDVPSGYTVSVTGTATGFKLTNSHTPTPPPTPPTPPVTPPPETVNVPVTKVWDDDNDADGERPGSVTVVLVRNGEETAMTAVLSEANGWSYTFTNLPKKDASGTTYVYTVKEREVPGYTMELEGDAASGFVITNTKNVVIPPDEPPLTIEDPPVPLTGDESRILLWIGLGMASLGGIMMLRRKHKEEEDSV